METIVQKKRKMISMKEFYAPLPAMAFPLLEIPPLPAWSVKDEGLISD